MRYFCGDEMNEGWHLEMVRARFKGLRLLRGARHRVQARFGLAITKMGLELKPIFSNWLPHPQAVRSGQQEYNSFSSWFRLNPPAASFIKIPGARSIGTT